MSIGMPCCRAIGHLPLSQCPVKPVHEYGALLTVAFPQALQAS